MSGIVLNRYFTKHRDSCQVLYCSQGMLPVTEMSIGTVARYCTEHRDSLYIGTVARYCTEHKDSLYIGMVARYCIELGHC